MKSISTKFIAATVLLGATQVCAFGALVYKGCFSSSDGLTYNSSYIFNTKGYCQTQCAPLNDITFATANSTDCWCGNELPPASALVADSFCNAPCAGYDTEDCMTFLPTICLRRQLTWLTGGGAQYWSVYL